MTAPPQQLTRRRAETRDKLLDAAIVAFAERGIPGASVEEICEQAGFTRGAFYSNFTSKDDLAMALLRREGIRQLAEAEAAIATIAEGPEDADLDPDTKISMAVSAFARSQSDDRSRLLVLRELRTYAVRNPAAAESVLQFNDQCRDEIRDLISNGLRLMGREFSLDPEQAIDMIIAVFEHAIFDSLLRNPESEKANMAASLDLLVPFLGIITHPV